MPETTNRKPPAAAEVAVSPVDPPAGEATSPAAPATATRAERAWAAFAWAVPLALIAYLAFRQGGYGAQVRLEVGLGVGAFVLAGAAAGVVPRPGLSRSSWILLGLFAAFAAWTALSAAWSDSVERSVAEGARVAVYLGIFLLAISLPGGDRARRLVGAVATAIAVAGVFALLSRLHPQWFGPNTLAEAQPLSRARLAYPIDAWNGLATFLSMGFPLLLAISVDARHAATRLLAAAALPMLGLATYLTYSRGGALAAAAGLIALIAIHRRRLALLAVGAVAAAGAGALIYATEHRDALANGLDDATAHRQGTEIILMLLIVCGLVAAARLGLQALEGRGKTPRVSVSRRTVLGVLAAGAVVALAVCVAAGVPSKLSDKWEEFKQPSIGGQGASQRFSSTSGNGRYQYWQAAIDAGESDPVAGIGAGGFEFWWAQHATIPGFVRDAHSLYIETFGELGIVGVLLLLGFVVGVLVVGVRAARRAPPAAAGMPAAATAGAAAFSVALAFDWGWEIAVIPVTYILLVAAILGASADGGGSAIWLRRRQLAPRLAGAAGAAAILFVLATVYVGVTSVSDSQEAFLAGDIDKALSDARTAQDFQPYAASPLLQEALLLEQTGNVHTASALAMRAATKEPTNWRIWLTLSRLQVADGKSAASVASYERARALNPQSVLIPTADPRVTHPDQF